MPLAGKTVLVTGGTGSLGKVLVRRILTGEWGRPKEVRVFSRDEGKQHHMRVQLNQGSMDTGLKHRALAEPDAPVKFLIGDVRDKESVARAMLGAQVVFNAAALKQVPSCEYFPWEAVQTNVGGAHAIVQAAFESFPRPEVVIGISTDKACKPVNAMGMSKAIQERVFQKANLDVPGVRFACVRYGNVLASRGSVIPLFHHQIAKGGPVTVTDRRMTRFFLTLDQAVDTVMAALSEAAPGETFVPRVRSAKISDLAEQMVDSLDKRVSVEETSIRPGEKLHEELVSTEESKRTVIRMGEFGTFYSIQSVLPEVRESGKGWLDGRAPYDRHGGYSSSDDVMNSQEVRELLARYRLLDPPPGLGRELLR